MSVFDKISTFVKNPNGVVLFVLTFYFLSFMTKSDSFYEPYLLVGLLGLYAFYKNKKSEPVKIGKLEFGFASFLTICILLANYKILNITLSNGKMALCFACLNLLVLFYGIYMLFRDILVYLLTLRIQDFRSTNIANLKSENVNKNCNSDNIIYFGKVEISSRGIFLFSLIVLSLPNLTLLVVSDYPGILTVDSFNSLKMAVGLTPYDNLNPIYFSLLVGFFIHAGEAVFNDLNLSIFAFSAFQIIVMSLILSFVTVTIFQITNNFKITVLSLIFLAVLPLNLTYFHTMWKDVWFAGGLVLFSTSAIRYLLRIGKHRLNSVFLVVGCLMSCIMRHNGIIVLGAMFLVAILLFRKERIFCLLIGCSVVVSLVMVTATVVVLDAKSSDLVESVSIPIQQIARVIVEGKTITNEEQKLLEKAISIDEIQDKYNEHISDPLKSAIRANGRGAEYIESHKAEFFKLYIDLGLRYPRSYVRAWIEQTKGFWNAGYDRIIDRFMPSDAMPQVRQVPLYDRVNNLLEEYLLAFRSLDGVKLFSSIGLYFWVFVTSFYTSIKRKNLQISFVVLLFLLVTGTYIIATPLYVDYRYSYYLFLGMPLILSLLYAGDLKQSYGS